MMKNRGDKLSNEELERYARQLAIPEIGVEGQLRLKSASVLIVGAGGLGSAAGLYLAAAGIGRIGLVDGDTVEPGNLQRQVLYDESVIGELKVEAACGRLQGLISAIHVEGINARLTAENALELTRDFDILVDCSDNFATRILVSDVCVLTHKPDVFAAASRWQGQVSVFDARRGPCYRCLFPSLPAVKAAQLAAGILGSVAGTIGCLQAAEVIKLVLGAGVPLIGRMLEFNALDQKFEEVRLKKNPNCAICGESPSLTRLVDA